MTNLLLRDRIGGDLVIEVAFTTSALDVSDHGSDSTRSASLATIAKETGAEPQLMHQVHGADVVVVNDLRPSSPPHCDALVTAQMGVALMARAADCVPVLIADPETGWIAAVHAGRPGLAQGVVPQAVAEMRSMGANPQVAWLGPHVCGACYEVPEQLQTDVVALVPQAKALTSWGTPSLDLGAGLHAQLAQDGVTDVRRVNICTRESQEWPSFRRDGERATRFAGVIWSHR